MKRYHAIAIAAETTVAACFGPFGQRNAAFSALNFAFATVCFAHTGFLSSKIAYDKVVRRYSVLFVCGSQLKRLIGGLVFLSLSSIYHYAIFRAYVCSGGRSACEGIHKAFRIVWILLVALNSMQTCVVAAFFWTFATQRLRLWKQILELEDSLLFNEEIKSQCSVVCRLTDYYNAKSFLNHWTSLSREEIVDSLQSKAEAVYKVMSAGIRRRESRSISLGDFSEFAKSEKIVDGTRIWNLFSDGTSITVERIYDALYDLSFDRQRFANMIRTDFRIIRWIFLYMAAVVLAGCFVFIARILDYEDAFGQGVDLLKVYILVMSYIGTSMKDRIVFLQLMFTQRPYDIGDLLRIGDEVYSVQDFDPGFTYLSGSTSLMVSNAVLLENPVANLTRSGVIDSVELTMPPNIPGEASIVAQAALEDYAHKNARIVDASSIRCGWSRTDKNGCKVLIANWKYNCPITDRTAYLWARTRIVDHLVRFSSEDLSQRSLSLQAAAGGAYNALAKYD